MNPVAVRLIGLPEDEILGQPFTALIRPDYRQRALAFYRSQLARQEDNSYFEVPLALEREIWVGQNVQLVRHNGRITGFQAAARDVTEYRRTEAEMERMLAKERELNDLKSRFVAMASHEFRTPLATILSSAELIERFGAKWGPEKIEKHLGRIQQNVQNMVELLDDILVLGRDGVKQLSFKPAPLSLKPFVDKVVEEIEQGLGAQHELVLINKAALTELHVDEKLLRLVLNNLLSNAIKYSEAGSTVRVAVTQAGEQVTFVVEDEGIGIPEEDFPRLFESFHRAGNVGRIGGTGLGLAIVKRAVDLHAGRITCQSTPGIGTTFSVTLHVVPHLEPGSDGSTLDASLIQLDA